MGKGGVIGSFEIGKEADFTVMDFGALLPYRQNAKTAADLTAEDIVSLCIYRGRTARGAGDVRPRDGAFSARWSRSCSEGRFPQGLILTLNLNPSRAGN